LYFYHIHCIFIMFCLARVHASIFLRAENHTDSHLPTLHAVVGLFKCTSTLHPGVNRLHIAVPANVLNTEMSSHASKFFGATDVTKAAKVNRHLTFELRQTTSNASLWDFSPRTVVQFPTN
jgi:hypothetical protein